MRRRVLLPDRVGQGVDRNDIQDRRERFCLHERPLVARAHDGRLYEVAGLRHGVSSVEHLATRGTRGGNSGQISLYGARIDERTHQRAGVEGVSDLHLAISVDESLL